jgi:uncharacterized protein YqgC (DUF456 family)
MAKTWQVFRGLVGILLIIVGIVGTVLPLIPGIPLLVTGLAIIGFDTPVVRALTSRLRRWRVRLTRSSGREP